MLLVRSITYGSGASMTPERFQQVRELFGAALEREPGARGAFLREACQRDQELLGEVERLLRSHEQAGSFLEANASSGAGIPTLGSAAPPVRGRDRYAGQKLKERYEIDRELGRGGFGVVYLARDTLLHGKPIVVKILLDKVDRSGWFEKKFRQECEALARINHPGVVGVLDQGQTPDGTPFLVMEFVQGTTLRSALKQGPLELERAGGLVRQMGQALSAAHEQGVYHRDLKPENVILRDVGGGQQMPVIIDFGVATVKDTEVSGAVMTRIAGSYPYMAPEQLTGKPEAASDIYALGVMAYEMMTGRRPFDVDSPVQLYFEQKQGVKVKPSALRAGLPEPADAAILKALSYEPKDRYAHAAEFGDEMARTLGSAAAPAPASPVIAGRPMLTRRRAVVLAASLAGAAALAVIAFIPGGESPPLASPALPERTLSYFVVVQKHRNGKPFQDPFRLPGEMIFPAGYGIRLVFSSSQAGRLYLINEGPVVKDGLPSFNVLFPTPARQDGSALLQPGEEAQIPPGSEYFIFDEQQGEERLWIIWAGQSVPELESVKKWVNERNLGSIADSGQVVAVKEFLVKHGAEKPHMEKDEVNKRTLLRGRGEVLVSLLRLEHR